MYWVPGVFLGILELVQRETGKPVDMPVWVFWLVFGTGVLLAAFLTFHELRKASELDTSVDVRRRVSDELGQIINEGETMAGDSWPGIAGSEEEAWRFAADWWNGAGVFVEAVLGVGERQVISEPISGGDRRFRLQAQCNFLRGTLQRLPDADIRVGEAGLQDAISARQPTAYHP
jgi:hypothetical protein